MKTSRRKGLSVSRTLMVMGMLSMVVVAAPLARGTSRFLVEAESFQQPGGWVVDQQFMDVMGSPYLLAHGIGKPCLNARTAVVPPAAGKYRIWVRTKDWVAEPEWAPGLFRIALDGKPLNAIFGTQGNGAWIWQDGGMAELAQRQVNIEIQDLTGFDGRCDALYFTTDLAERPPAKAGEEMTRWRQALLGQPPTPPPGGDFDVVVVGGGLAGCTAAITAARLGCRVALVQDRPVLGGNNSPEVGVTTWEWGIPGKLVAPEVSGNFPNYMGEARWWNPPTSPVIAAAQKRQRVVDGEKNLKSFLGWHVFRAQKEGPAIASVDARNIISGRELRFDAPVFIDCTGDGWVGYYAGAEFRQGQEGRAEHNESLAPEQPGKMVLGTTLLWYATPGEQAVSFPDVPWATVVSKGRTGTHGDWQWEYGHYRDTIWEAEEIRDHLFRAIYGTFATTKRKNPDAMATLELRRVNYIGGKRESRRLMGDYLMTQADCWDNIQKPDAVAQGGNPFDLHVPVKGYDFIVRVDAQISLKERRRFDIPLRCLYSRNVDNLLMAGRCASVTRIAHAAMRLQNTGAQEGVAVGAAAFMCKKYAATPREIGKKHIKELQDIVFDRGNYVNALKPPAGESIMENVTTR